MRQLKYVFIIGFYFILIYSFLTPALALVGASGVRNIEPCSLEPGDTFTVTVIISAIDADITSITLEEKLPDDWEVTPLQNDGLSYDYVHYTEEDLHTWYDPNVEVLEAGDNKTIVYNVTVPTGISGGTYDIEGWISVFDDDTLEHYASNVVGNTSVELTGDFISTSTDWPMFGIDLYNNAVTSDRAPIQEPEKPEKNNSESWATMTYGLPGAYGIDVHPLVVGEMVYVTAQGYVGNDDTGNPPQAAVFAVNRSTGEIEWKSDIVDGLTAPLGTPAYGNGKLFVISFGQLYAYDAVSGKELLNITIDSDDLEVIQLNSPMIYDDGKVFFGEWLSTGNEKRKYFCYNEDGTLDWTYVSPTGQGYYWAGASIIGRYLVFGDDALHLTSLDKYDGELIDEINISKLLGFGYDRTEIRNSISYSPETGRLYSSSEEGYCFSIGFNADGTFNTSDMQKVYIGKSTCTPTVYNGRVYVGTGTHTGYGDVYCLQEEDLSVIWKYTPNGGVQGSPVVSTAYDDGDGEVYIYFTTNVVDARVYCFKDYTGNTEAELQWYYEAPSEMNHYTLHGVSIKNGRMFYGNDRGYLFGLAEWNPWDDPNSDSGELMTTPELQKSIYCWLYDEPAPVTGSLITTSRLQRLINNWLES